MPFKRVYYRAIPSSLYHYTSGVAAHNIMKGGHKSHEDICFWLKNAKEKNDEAELKLGTILTERLRLHMQQHNRPSLFEEVSIDPELVFINSFTEEEQVSEYMIQEYGNFRLEFDFRMCHYKHDIHECTYFKEEDIEELTQCYCATFERDWPLISGEKKDIHALTDYLLEEMSAIRSIPLLKHLEEWEQESEWRHVLHKQSLDDRVFSFADGSLRMKVYYPSDSLVSVTCITSQSLKHRDLPSYYKIKDWVKRCGWKTRVQIHFADV